jgi:hypothetical protein
MSGGLKCLPKWRAFSTPGGYGLVKELVFSDCHFRSKGAGDFFLRVRQRAVRVAGLVGSIGRTFTPIGAGHIAIDRVSAAMGALRVIGKPCGVEPALRPSWTASCKWLVNRLLDEYWATDPQWQSESIVSRYRRVSRGKPKSQVESVLKKWSLMKEHPCGIKAATRRDAFAKDEANYGGNGLARARMITPMSAEVSVQTCGVVDVADNYHKVPNLSGSHIKHKSPDEVRRMLWIAQSRGMDVTDYSAFEGSIGQDGRLVERLFIRAALNGHGEKEMADFYWKESGRVQTIGVGIKGVKLKHCRRCSGDFSTSFGNYLVNVGITFYCLVKLGGLQREEAYLRIFRPGQEAGTGFVFEGDDGLTDPGVLNNALVERLGFKIGSKVSGDDADFLRKWYPFPPERAGPVVNILRVMRSLLWLRGSNLVEGKRRYLLRAAAWSCWHLAPGHPVLTTLVKVCGKLTSGASKFKSAKMFYGHGWVDPPDDAFEKHAELVVNDQLRGQVEIGRGPEVPMLSQSTQHALEKEFERTMGYVRIGKEFDHYPEYLDMLESSHLTTLAKNRFDEPANSASAEWLLRSFMDPRRNPHPLVR